MHTLECFCLNPGLAQGPRGQIADLFLVANAVAAHELVDATCGIDELLLAGEEGV